jgi:hypothetical protein
MVDLKGAYYAIEDKWYAFVDSVSAKLPFFGTVVDKVEDKGMPSFPLAIILLIIIILAIFFLLGAGGAPLIINVQDTEGAITGASVSVFFDGELKGETQTNAEGKAAFSLAPGDYVVKIDKEGYISRTRDASTGDEITINLTLEDFALTKTITLKKASGEIVKGSGIINYSCADEAQKTGNFNNGYFDADFSDCEIITIDSVSGYDIVEGRISLSGTNSVVLEEREVERGTITVSLNAEDDLAGLRVTMKGTDGVPEQMKTISEGTSTAVFENMPTKEYYVSVFDPQGKYESYSGSELGETKELRKDETISFNVSLVKSTSSTITINVKDFDTALAIEGAEVKLMQDSQTTESVVDSEVTGESGQVIFNVSEGSTYYANVEHPNYLIPGGITVSAGTTKTFNLIEATQTNSQTLLVRIVDPRGEGVGNTRVTLKKLDDTKIDEKTTNSQGEIEFYNLELINYYVYAIKEGFDGVTSNAIQILPRQENVLETTMDIGMGRIEINVYDSGGGLMNGVKVKAINYFTNEIEAEEVTSGEGKAEFSIREDKKVYFVVESSEYLDYYTSAFYPDADTSIVKEVHLKQTTNTANVKIKGIYSGEEELGAERIISPGRYIVRATLEVPEGSFSESGFHLRTGRADDGRINLMEEDSAKLGDVDSSANKVTKGTTYSPGNYSIDSGNTTRGIAKWIEAKWNNPKEGLYEIEVELIVEEVNENEGINLWYRGYAKGNATIRDPTNTNPGQELYASANNYLLTGGASNLCGEKFCISKKLETISGQNAGRVQFINNKFNGVKGNTYKLTTEITARQAINGGVMEIEGKGIAIEEILVNNTEREEIINLGNLQEDAFVRIEVLFEVTASGTNELKLIINSSSARELEENTIINVQANKKFDLEIIPKQIIPFVTNQLFLEVKDGNTPIKDAIIELTLNDNVLDTIETNAEGMAEYELYEPSIGDNLKVEVSKEGYDNLVVNKEVEEQLLIITPPEINNTIKIGEVTSIDVGIVAENGTVEDLEIESIRFDGELESYLNLEENIEGTIIKAGEEANYSLKVSPNSTAERLREAKTVEGRMEIIVTIKDGESYASEIPIKIRLSMPGYLDSQSCLKVTPGSVEFNTSTQEITQNLEIENTCTAEGIKVILFDLEARLNQTSKFGVVNISGSAFNNASLGEGYSEIADSFTADTKENITLRFSPNTGISSGKQNMEITFRGTNIPEEGKTETVETHVNLEVAISNLSKCIEIEEPASGLVLDVAGWNLGQSRIMNSNLAANAQNYQGFRNTMPYGMTQQLAYMSNTTNQQYEQDRFTIKNNCATDVAIDLDPDSRINVSEEKFTISAGSDATIDVSPGYILGRYSVKINGKIEGSEDAEQQIDSLQVTVRRLGDIDNDCIKTNVTKLSFNSFLYEAEQYKIYNHCYNSGVQLNRNNAVSIKCDAPNITQNFETMNNMPMNNLSYLQRGQEQLYASQLPINNQFPTYNSHLGKGCEGSSCPLIAGTRTVAHRIIENGGTATEEVTFEVMPSSQYMAQRRLFDSQRNVYGLFQNLVDIRQWATETNARTGVYGNLNVSYSNQYGSSQCMSFPITVEDSWRMLESVDSAINWGDPNASPQDCVGSEEKKALDLVYKFGGKIPDTEYNTKGTYVYVAEPPAVHVGPAPATGAYMPRYPANVSADRGENSSSSVASNCGLMDTISDISYKKEFGGVKIKVESMKSGSLINNTFGPNLGLEIDRTGIQHDCVYIKTPVTATLRRAINWESAEITWPLKAVVTKPGFDLTGYEDKLTEVCYYDGKEGSGQGTTENLEGCTEDAKEYGFDKIKVTNTEEMKLEGVKGYCEKYFCNNDMLQIMLLDKYQELKDKLEKVSGKAENDSKLSEIYKLADKDDLNTCRNTEQYYTKRFGGIIYTENDLTEELDKEMKEIINVNDDVLKDNAKTGPIVAMRELLEDLTDEDTEEEMFVLYTKDSENKFVALEAYLKANIKALDGSTTIQLDDCSNYTNYFTTTKLKEIAEGKPRIVQAIKVGKNEYSADEENLIYNTNSDLLKIHELATYNENYNKALYLTAEESFVPIEISIFDEYKNYPKYTPDLKGEDGPAIYNVELDGTIKELAEGEGTITINLNKKEEVNKAKNNILLKEGFKFNEIDNSLKEGIDGTIINTNGDFYKRAPVMLTAKLHGLEPWFAYKPKTQNTGSVINWRMGEKTISEIRDSRGLVVELGTASGERELKGLYYWNTDEITIFETKNRQGVTITAKALVNNSKTASASTKDTASAALELPGLEMPTLEEIIEAVNEKEACVSENGNKITWNQKKLLGITNTTKEDEAN